MRDNVKLFSDSVYATILTKKGRTLSMIYFLFFLSIVLLLGALINLTSRLDSPAIKGESRAQVKKALIKVLIWGIIGVALSFLNIYMWNNILSFEAVLIFTVGGGTIVSLIAILVCWAVAPSEKSITEHNDMVERKEIFDNELDGYKYCKTIMLNNFSDEICISDDKNQLILKNELTKKHSIIELNEVIECELLENNTVIAKGGVGRAVVGGILAGGAGAIVGATTSKKKTITSYKLRIITKNTENPTYIYEVKSFDVAQEAYGTITSLISNDTTPAEVPISNDAFAQLEKLAVLKDKGILTESEYEGKKHELLDKIK